MKWTLVDNVDDGVRETEGIGFDDVDTVDVTVEGSVEDEAVEDDGKASSKLIEDGPVENKTVNIYDMYKPTRRPLALRVGVNSLNGFLTCIISNQ